MRRTRTHWSIWIAGGVYAVVFAATQAAPHAAAGGPAQATPAQAPVASTRTGAELYTAACAACHGSDGKGRERSVVGFDRPLPDFTDCSFATREPDSDWLAIVHDGGPARGFSTTMPAFGEAFGAADLTKIVGHMRTFCTSAAWPRGDLNLPRAFATEKAFPEDEAVLTTSVALSGPGAISNEIVYEKRFGARNQIELKFPFESAADDAGAWAGGAGDLSFGFKRAFAHNLKRGYIFAVTGELIFPTGDEAAGLSKGTTIFEPFLSFGQVLPKDAFIHAQVGMELPLTDRAEKEGFWRMAFGKTFTQGRFGRAWSPMFEVLGAKALVAGDAVVWDVIPQVQITLNTRQHLIMNVGVRVPVNERSGRHPKLMVYFLWDWFDGGLRDGW